MQTKNEPILIVIMACALALGACSGVGPKKKEAAGEQAKSDSKALYEPDLSKPDGPLLQMLRAAQDRDEALFRASFAPNVDTAWMSEEGFKKFRKKVLSSNVTPVPESAQMNGDNDAVVRLRNARGKEIPVKVTKIDGKWFIAEIGLGQRLMNRMNEKNPKAAPAAPAAPQGKSS